jgi:rSAM/selenodomain-associated transferase 1
MARLPLAGSCKTRLCPPLSEQQAASLYQAFLIDIGRELAHWSTPTDLWVAWTGSEDEPGVLVDFFPPRTRFVRQQGESLAGRMNTVFDHLFELGYRRIVMRNSDSPHLPLSFIESAFAALQHHAGSVVLGPDLDGGYYLVGLDRPPAGVFPEPMSTESVFEQTVALAEDQERRVEELPAFLDIDDADDLCTFWLEFGGRADIRHWATWRFIEDAGLMNQFT